MIIDKTYGIWDLINPPIIDDIAYYLCMKDYIFYCNHCIYLNDFNVITKYDPPCQSWVKVVRCYKWCDNIVNYYEKATHIVEKKIRKEKLTKLYNEEKSGCF